VPQKSHITVAELEALRTSGLTRESPYAIAGVSQSQFSVARLYGGCTAYGGVRYVYVPPTDELIRADVIKFLAKYRAAERKKKSAEAKKAQGDLF